ncbi:MAG: response regulator [Burkholderiales bacterium]|nr:response regulator [Burkholderiales bacterium]
MADHARDSHANATIMVVEDSPTQAEQLRYHLEQHNYNVVLAADGREALDFVQKCRPNLIITDVVMPGMDGFQLCQMIKADAALQDIPVVIVTSLTGWDDIARSLECGAENFLRKPYEPETLIARVDSILLNHELRKRNRVQMGLEILLGGKRHFVNSDREQILDLLISTYDEALHMNAELQARQAQIAHANQVLRGLYQISQQLAQSESPHVACATLLHGIGGLPGFSPGWIVLYDANGALHVVAAEHMTPAPECQAAPHCACLAVLNQETNAVGTQLLSCPCRNRGQPDAKLLAITPLQLTDEVVGAMVTMPEATSDKSTLDILDTVGRQISAVLERIALLDRLHQRAVELETANKELESFSYSVSHDLSSPLRAIDGFSRKLEQRLDLSADPESRRLLGVIRNSCQRMNALIKGLLEFSRLSRVPLRDMTVDMVTVVEDVIAELRQHTEYANFAISIDTLPASPGDFILLRQVWENLLSNAIKYSSTHPAPEVRVRGWRDGAFNVYAVKDNGAGFDMHYYGKLFGVFQRLHREDEYPGTGIGLANVKRIVSRHGGNVWAEGAPGAGATFFFSLPAGD